MEERVDLDLNQEPWEIHHDDSALGLGSLLNDIGAVHGRIEERIQQLEALTSRAMQRRRLRIQEDQSQTTTRPVVGGDLIEAPVNNEPTLNVALDDNARRSSTKRSNSHLIAKALEMEMEVDRKKIENDSGGFFDCNICLEIPKEPILTCCGHMFCWACFYRLPYDQSGVRECPECMGEVSDKSVIPIYGSNDAPCDKSKSADFEFKVPPRPRASRAETVRQQSWVTGTGQQTVNRGFTTFHIQEALRRVVSNRVEVAGVQTPPQEVEVHQVHLPVNSFVDSDTAGASQVPSEEDNSQHLRILRYSRLLSAEAASLSSLSTTLTSALNSVESMVDDLETIIHSHPISGNVSQENPPINNTSNSTPGNHTLEPISSSTSTPDFIPSSVHISGEQISNAASSQMNPTAPSSYPSPRVTEWIPRTSGVATRSSRRRRRNSDVNNLDVENGRAPRRRRFG